MQKQYEALEKRISRLDDEGKDNEAGELSEESTQLENSMTHLLGQRIEIIRAMESVKTIEQAFPRVKRETKEEKAKVDAAKIIRMFNAGNNGIHEVRAAGRQMQAPRPEQLSEQEMEEFAAARAQLAIDSGYEVSQEEEWFEISRNGVRLVMKHFAFPSSFGISGDDRILKMFVDARKGGAAKLAMNYDHGWDAACTDPGVQKEIDRAIAIFG